MICPLCNVEARIESVDPVLKTDGLYNRIAYKCRTKDCPNYNKVFKTEDTKSDKPLIVETNEVPSAE